MNWKMVQRTLKVLQQSPVRVICQPPDLIYTLFKNCTPCEGPAVFLRQGQRRNFRLEQDFVRAPAWRPCCDRPAAVAGPLGNA